MSTVYSDIGKRRLKIYAGLLAVDVIVIALSARVNQYQEYYFMADLFPLGLSITTFILLSTMLILDFSLNNPVFVRPPFEIGLLAVLTILWLAFNAFSTSRWRYVPLACGSIPIEYADERVWCRDLQALKAFVWVEWVALLLIFLSTLRLVLHEYKKGNTLVWSTALSRYSPYANRGRNMVESVYQNAFGQRTSSFWAGERSYQTFN